MAKPLTTLLKKEVRWKWTKMTNDAFLQLKQAKCTTLVLTLFDFNSEFYLDTDVSDHGIEAMLHQHEANSLI